MKKQNNMPPLVFIVAFLYAPLILIFASNFLNTTLQLYEAPDWAINIARPINGVIALLCIVYLFIVERKILTKSPELIKKGVDQELIALLCGAILLEFPACLAFFFFMFGSSIVDVYIYSALSFAAIIAWAWRYRRLLLTMPADAKHKHITDNTLLIPKSSSVNTNAMVRPYTVVLGIIGSISFLFLASEIMSVIHPPEDYYYLGQKEMTILTISLYLLFSLSCWITTILRTKKSPFASLATRATSYILIAWFPFGTAAFFYWIGKVRKKENMG